VIGGIFEQPTCVVGRPMSTPELRTTSAADAWKN
jgi:hypothetical protein